MELVWHPHHEAESPLEVIESFEDRMKVIAEVKAIDETPEQIAQRYKFIKKFEGELPDSLKKAYDEWKKAEAESWKVRDDWAKATDEYWKAWDDWAKAEVDKARDERDKTWDEVDKAWDEVDKALRSPEVMALHAEQCGCDWSPTNRNIFNLTKPEKTG